jgi:transposase
MRRHELTDFEWKVIEPRLPNKPRGVPRVNDRRVLNGILWRFRTGSPWRDVPERYGPSTTCYNRFVRWREAGVGPHPSSCLGRLRRRSHHDRLLVRARPSTWSDG